MSDNNNNNQMSFNQNNNFMNNVNNMSNNNMFNNNYQNIQNNNNFNSNNNNFNINNGQGNLNNNSNNNQNNFNNYNQNFGNSQNNNFNNNQGSNIQFNNQGSNMQFNNPINNNFNNNQGSNIQFNNQGSNMQINNQGSNIQVNNPVNNNQINNQYNNQGNNQINNNGNQLINQGNQFNNQGNMFNNQGNQFINNNQSNQNNQIFMNMNNQGVNLNDINSINNNSQNQIQIDETQTAIGVKSFLHPPLTDKTLIKEINNNINDNYNKLDLKINNIENKIDDFQTSMTSKIANMQANISDIKTQMNNANLTQLSSDLNFLKSQIIQIQSSLSSLSSNNNNNNNKNNINIPNKNDLNLNIDKKVLNPPSPKIFKIFKDPNEKDVIISMNDKDILIKININTITLDQFKNMAKKYFKINDNTIIHYYNDFGLKIIIQNEPDFKQSLSQKILKYYFSEKINDFNLNNDTIINQDINTILNKINIIDNSFNNNNNNNFNNNNLPKKNLDNNINNFKNEINNNNNFIPKNINVNNQQKNLDLYKDQVKDVMNHFASLAFLPSGSPMDTGDFISSAAYLSDLMNKINIAEKKLCPKKFHNPKKVLKLPGLISSKFEKNEQVFVLSMLSDVLEEKGINTSIYKDNVDNKNIDGATLQYLFNGFTEKKKYKINFDVSPDKTNLLLKKGNELKLFIQEWKLKISKKLNINSSEVFLVNPQENSGFNLDLVTNETNIQYNNLKNFPEIKNINEKPLIEGCQLNSDIFEPKHNNQDPGWGINETRGGEKYIPPLGWYGYGLKVGKKYDNGNDQWLNYIDGKGVYAVAYFGLSNLYQNKNNYNKFFNEINSPEALKIGYEQTYKNDINIKEQSKNEYKTCGSGVYLFQDPKIAENTASIIDIGGVRYKMLLMCRVNPNKIRQPSGFKDCWILNPIPSEVRPYRILIKKIFQSPLAGASQNEIKTFNSMPEYCKDIIIKKDTSFLIKNNTTFNNDNFVINLYTSNAYTYLNNYLREGKITPDSKYTEKEIKSWAWCLHNALTHRKSNVKNGSIFYRGVSRKFPPNLGIGSKFYFAEFTSVSEDKNVAMGFACNGTLFIIRIENNNGPQYYCYNVSDVSCYKHEKETLITSNCTFHVTNILKKNKDEDSLDEVYLTCEGFKPENINKNDIISINKIKKSDKEIEINDNIQPMDKECKNQ